MSRSIRLSMFAAALIHLPMLAQMPPPFPDLQSAVDAALLDARSRTGDELKVVRSEQVTWRDASLGCPQPGMGYGQALVPGYRIRLEAASRGFDYHASARGALVLCPPGRAKRPAPRGRT